MAKKQTNNTSRKKRTNWHSRLPSGQHWLRQYNGESPSKAYAKRYGVSELCALRELRLLGLSISKEVPRATRERERQKTEARAAQKRARIQKLVRRLEFFPDKLSLVLELQNSSTLPGQTCPDIEFEEFLNG